MLRRELASRRPRGRAERTFMDGVKEGVEMVGVRACRRMQTRLDVSPKEKKRKKIK